MPEEEYSPLKVLLLDNKLEGVRALADLCHSDRTPLATSLLRIFRFDKKEAELLSALNRFEVEREEETSTLFRAASLTTSLMDLYMKSVCTEFLHTAIFPTIHRYGLLISSLYHQMFFQLCNYPCTQIIPYRIMQFVPLSYHNHRLDKSDFDKNLNSRIRSVSSCSWYA